MTDLNIEKKPIEELKDNLKNENISDIKAKNQSKDNNSNSYSKSFDIENNNNNKEREKNFINIIINKDSKHKTKEEEIKFLLYNNNGNKKEKYDKNNNNDRIIKRVNKMPEIESYSKFRYNHTLKKMKNIKNKSLERKVKDLLNNDKKENHQKNKNDTLLNKKDNKFIQKLKQIELKFEKINEYKNKKNIIELIEKNYENENNKENINDINNKENWLNMNFNINIKNGASENKFQELKKLYFSKNKFDFSNVIKNNNKYTGNNFNSNRNQKQNMNIDYSKNSKISEDYKESNANYNINSIQNLKRRNNKNMIRIMNNSDNFKNIVDKIDIFEHSKKIYNSYLHLNEIEKKRKANNKSNPSFFKSVSLEKPSNLKNIMNDVYSEINKTNSYSLRRNFSNKISNLKYSTYINIDNSYGINNINSINQYKSSKSKELNFDDLLNLCSKRNLQSFFNKGKINL